MKPMPITTRSFWQASVSPRTYAPLAGDIHTDVCVVGGGLGGVTTAYRLAKAGARVALIEAYSIGAGETGRTTAHIAVPDDRYAYIEKKFGAEAARLVADSYAAALDFIEATAAAEDIACDFRRVNGYLYSQASDPERALETECEAARRAGVSVTYGERLPLGFFDAGPCLRFADQGQFHPLMYLHGLAAACERAGGVLHEQTRALDVEESGEGVVVRTPSGNITAKAAVLATNTPFHQRFAMHTKQAAYQTYAVAAYVQRDSIPPALVWDDGDPYFYVRTTPTDDPSRDLLIVGGADHKTGHARDAEQSYAEVARWTREHFPQVDAIAFRWSGEVMEPVDGLAYLGRSPGSHRTYLITGDSGNGMTHTTIGGLLISDLVLGRANAWTELYDPARKATRAPLEYARQQSDVAAQYGDWLASGDEPDTTLIAPGEGAVIRKGLKKYAVSRDMEGALHIHSATCTHLGCIVQWNSAERTWDCPCHGSRFSSQGEVLHGPAKSALALADDEAQQEIISAETGAPRTQGSRDQDRR